MKELQQVDLLPAPDCRHGFSLTSTVHHPNPNPKPCERSSGSMKTRGQGSGSELTSHTGSRGPAPCRCPSAGSCRPGRTSPAAAPWPGCRFSRNRRATAAHTPTPCFPQGERRSSVLSDCERDATEREKKKSVGFHTSSARVQQRPCTLEHCAGGLCFIGFLCLFFLYLPFLQFLLEETNAHKYRLPSK